MRVVSEVSRPDQVGKGLGMSQCSPARMLTFRNLTSSPSPQASQASPLNVFNIRVSTSQRSQRPIYIDEPYVKQSSPAASIE